MFLTDPHSRARAESCQGRARDERDRLAATPDRTRSRRRVRTGTVPVRRAATSGPRHLARPVRCFTSRPLVKRDPSNDPRRDPLLTTTHDATHTKMANVIHQSHSSNSRFQPAHLTRRGTEVPRDTDAVIDVAGQSPCLHPDGDEGDACATRPPHASPRRSHPTRMADQPPALLSDPERVLSPRAVPRRVGPLWTGVSRR